jgi:carboxylesterase
MLFAIISSGYAIICITEINIMKKRTRKFLKTFPLIVILLIVILKITACGYSEKMLAKDYASHPRDPKTGVVKGTEARNLGDPDSSHACLMVHGYLGSVKDFNDLPQRLADKGMYVRLMRLPGHGTRAEELQSVSTDDLYKAVETEYLALKKEHEIVDVVGFSMGGALSTMLASRQPVDRMVLVSPYYGVTMKWYYVLPPMWWNKIIGSQFEYLPKFRSFQRVKRKEAKEHIFSYFVAPTSSFTMMHELSELSIAPEVIQKVTCPVLILQSKKDNAASPKATKKVFKKLPGKNKQVVWYKKSDHILLWDHDREDAMKRACDFLDRKGPLCQHK